MKILFLGDSITDCSHCFTGDNLGNGYVKYIAEALPDCSVTNGGTDGFTFPRIYNKWKSMYRQTPYDAVVILGGINDAAVMTDTGLDENQAERYLSSSAAALRELLHDLISENVKQILVTEPFLFEEFNWTAAWQPGLERIRSMIRDTVQDRAVLVSFSAYMNRRRKEMLPACQSSKPLSTDGVHLTEAGHRLLAELLMGYLS